MNRISIWVLFMFSFFLLLHSENADEEEVKRSLIIFLEKLSNNDGLLNPIEGWNVTSDPCQDRWKGIVCDVRSNSVEKILLSGLNFSGTFDASVLCNVQALDVSLTVINLNNNNIEGENLDQIGNCRQLTRLQISGNRFSGSLPNSLSRLNNLKRLDLSNNKFSGDLPDFARIWGLIEFLAQNNQLTGAIPYFDFPNLALFNVSFNNFSGPIPFRGRDLPLSSFVGNPRLCGDPLPNKCPSLTLEAEAPSESKEKGKSKSKGLSRDQILMLSGCVLIGLALFFLLMFKLCKKNTKKEERVDAVNKVAAVNDSFKSSVTKSGEYKTGMGRSDISVASTDQSGLVSSSLIDLTSLEVNRLKFEDLLEAPAELLGRGKNGSAYKVRCEGDMTLAVKRIKDSTLPCDEFKQRMRRLDQVKHRNVLPALAFYCSEEEKLLVYQYQPNGSLFSLLHGAQWRQPFDWTSRLGVAATISEALAFMHQELNEYGLSHGNLKSSNILLNKNMESCISEYGIVVADNQDHSSLPNSTDQIAFKNDIYGFGVILLELLTGKPVQTNGVDLARWVLSVVREEWTGEVFDKTLIRQGASEERMVNLLQIAVKCVNCSSEARPSINQVAVMINAIKEEEERSLDFEA